MATLADVRSNVADMLRGRTDLNDQIDAEIANAIRHYNRRTNWITERRGGTITTVAGQHWYSTIDLTTGHGVEDSPSGTTPTASASLTDLVKLIYAKVENGNLDWPLDLVSYRTWETLDEGVSTSATPRYIAHFAGKIGLWPAPANAGDTIYLSGFFKPTVPTSGNDESVWFAQYRELIENAAAGRAAAKWLHDMELAQTYRGLAAEQEALLWAEGTSRQTTGRLTPTMF